jgi:hypothetical protein
MALVMLDGLPGNPPLSMASHIKAALNLIGTPVLQKTGKSLDRP